MRRLLANLLHWYYGIICHVRHLQHVIERIKKKAPSYSPKSSKFRGTHFFHKKWWNFIVFRYFLSLRSFPKALFHTLLFEAFSCVSSIWYDYGMMQQYFFNISEALWLKKRLPKCIILSSNVYKTYPFMVFEMELLIIPDIWR